MVFPFGGWSVRPIWGNEVYERTIMAKNATGSPKRRVQTQSRNPCQSVVLDAAEDQS